MGTRYSNQTVLLRTFSKGTPDFVQFCTEPLTVPLQKHTVKPFNVLRLEFL